MEHFFSFVLVLLIGASGILTIYLLIDFFEYLKKYHTFVWDGLCFKRPFGVSNKDFFFYPIKPVKFVSFVMSGDDPEDSSMGAYKTRIKYAVIGLVAIILFNLIVRCFI